LKGAELKLIVELMKNSRRSDRELAKAVGVSQPTVNRMIKKLESEGYIKEYTAIPDFRKLGFELVSVNFVKFKAGTDAERIEKLKNTARQIQTETGLPSLLVMSGMGMGFDRVIIMYHRDYASYAKFKDIMKGAAEGNVEKFESFLAVLDGKNHFQPLSLSSLAKFLSLREAREESDHERNQVS
jgi:DNA-binding Lrp family transcriptional regulator